MNIRKQNWLINRRHVLKGLGVSLALPMFDCMRPLHAKSSAKKIAPIRSVFIYLPNGVNTLDYQILQHGKDYQFSKCLKPLERHRDLITPISGLHHPRAIGHQHGCQPVWLTGAQAGPTARNSVSIDQLIAQKQAPHTRFPALHWEIPAEPFHTMQMASPFQRRKNLQKYLNGFSHLLKVVLNSKEKN